MKNTNKRITIIVGMSGQGKSELTKTIIAERGKNERVIVFDTQMEYDGKNWEGKRIFRPIIVYSYIDLCDYLKEHFNDKNFVVVCRYESMEEHQQTISLIWKTKNILLVLEEISLYVSPTDKETDLNKIIHFGRHRNISLIVIARRAVEISPSLRSQTGMIYTFRQILPSDLKVLSEMGLPQVAELKSHHFAQIEY